MFGLVKGHDRDFVGDNDGEACSTIARECLQRLFSSRRSHGEEENCETCYRQAGGKVSKH